MANRSEAHMDKASELLRLRGGDLRAAVTAAVGQELDAIGSRLTNLRADTNAEIERLGAFLDVAADAGIRPGEIADRAQVSRQTVLNLRNQGRGEDREWNLDLKILLHLGCHGPHSVDALTQHLGAGPLREVQVESAIQRLVQQGSVSLLGVTTSGTQEVAYYYLAAQGVAELPLRLREAAIPPTRHWSAYVEVGDDEAWQLVEVGESVLGEHAVALIPPKTLREMSWTELAFGVEAHNAEDAATQAVARVRDLRSAAKRPQRDPILVRALIPPSA